MFDIQFRSPSTFILAASSGAGKTSFAFELLRNAEELFTNPGCTDNVVFYYREWQPLYDKANEQNLVTEWINKMPTYEDVKERTLAFRETGSVVLCDDYGDEVNQDIAKIFTTGSSHLNLVFILMVQNLFQKNPFYRDISLNATYIVLFKNPRDLSQVGYYGRQFTPGLSKQLVQLFKTATEKPNSYVVFDHRQNTCDFLRIRSHVLPHEFPPIVWFFDKNI